MTNKQRLHLLAMHALAVGLQSAYATVNFRDGDPVMFTFNVTMATFSAFCAYEFYGKILEDTETAP